jgi:hypothetical protein
MNKPENEILKRITDYLELHGKQLEEIKDDIDDAGLIVLAQNQLTPDNNQLNMIIVGDYDRLIDLLMRVLRKSPQFREMIIKAALGEILNEKKKSNPRNN